MRFVKESQISHLVRFLFYKFHLSAVFFKDFMLCLLLNRLVRIHLVRQFSGTKIRTKGVIAVTKKMVDLKLIARANHNVLFSI